MSLLQTSSSYKTTSFTLFSNSMDGSYSSPYPETSVTLACLCPYISYASHLCLELFPYSDLTSYLDSGVPLVDLLSPFCLFSVA